MAFRALHERPGAFIIPNPRDPGTARLLAALGFEAIATTRPVNVGTGWLDPDITAEQLAEAGAKRISVGGALSRLALAAIVDAGRAMQATGSFAWTREMASVAAPQAAGVTTAPAAAAQTIRLR
jgi:2-methylisocitrate lyase-like PEP mutase family enzyme